MSEQLLRTTCGYCSTGCNVMVQVKDGKPIKVLPANEYPVNLGRTCPKGYHMLKPLEAPDRATRPLLRNAAVLGVNVVLLLLSGTVTLAIQRRLAGFA